MSHCMMGNRVGNSMVGNRVSNSMRDGISQESDTMVSWCMVGHSMVGSMVGSMVDHWSSMMHNRGRMVDHWSSMVDHWSSVMDHWSSVMHNRGSVMHNRSMVNQRCSMHRCLIIVGLSSISHFLDHPVPTIVVSHSLHPTIRQGNSVGARGGVAIPGLLLLEVCSAVAIVDPVLVCVDGGLAQVLVGELRCWRSQARADKGQQQGHLHGGT